MVCQESHKHFTLFRPVVHAAGHLTHQLPYGDVTVITRHCWQAKLERRQGRYILPAQRGAWTLPLANQLNGSICLISTNRCRHFAVNFQVKLYLAALSRKDKLFTSVFVRLLIHVRCWRQTFCWTGAIESPISADIPQACTPDGLKSAVHANLVKGLPRQ